VQPIDSFTQPPLRSSPRKQLLKKAITLQDGNMENESKRSKYVVSFEEFVKIYPIPSRTEYSEQTRNALWISQEQMAKDYARNMREFQADNWDWREATEDENMYEDARTGELIHPEAFYSSCNVRGHFLQVMYANISQH